MNPDRDNTLAQPVSWVGRKLASERLQVIRQVGQGGMGTVYEAFDAERRGNVALKTLNRLDASNIYQLKNEFRSLADLRHPNLVRLHELFCDQGVWFFTMDLLEGERFDRWVRPERELSELRLRSALGQLLDALSAIHAVGKLHRDVKPSNVLVTADGHLVVLDFGLVVDPDAGSVGRTITSTEITGTPDYMAPEQATGQRATPATDLYAVGVMIYEALSGRRPFQGGAWEVLGAKVRDAAPRLERAVAPADLVDLCNRLLVRDPEQRPATSELLAATGSQRSSVPSRPSSRGPGLRERSSAPVLSHPPLSLDDDATLLVGRSAELAALHDAHAAACQNSCVVLAIGGDSGVGKSALCHAFLREVQRQGQAVVLTGRCYEQENVPFKAIDPAMDELSRYLRKLRPEHAAALLPRDAFALAKLFPVLSRVQAFQDAPYRNVPDPQELQRLAFAAFGEMLGRIRDRSPMILYIDDLQWTDADSAKFLRHRLVSRDLVPLLFIVSHRIDEATNPLLASILDAARENAAIDYRQLALHPLQAGDVRALAARVLGESSSSEQSSALIAQESGGNPFFALELARFARDAPDGEQAVPSLNVLLDSRVGALREPAQKTLQALAIAGRPLPVDVLLHATGAQHGDLDALRDAHLVRGSETAAGKLVECYHDRIREGVSATITVADRVIHQRGLARALQDQDEPELLSRCLEGAGEPEAAAQQAARAAERAAAALAFDHAAELYQRALQLTAATGPERRELFTKLGSSLENTGRGAEAADAYQSAAELASGDAALDLQRRAAEQLLHTGHLERGSDLLRAVCRPLSIELPSSAVGALLSLTWGQAKLRLRAPEQPRELSRAPVHSRHALRLRTLRTAVTGTIGYLPVHTASVIGQYLLNALDSSDVPDLVRALGFFAHSQTLVGTHDARIAATLARAVNLAQEDGRPELLGFMSLMQGTIAYHREQCREARDNLEQARRSLRGCIGVEWELDAANVYDTLSASYCGDYADLARTIPSLLDQAERRGRSWTAAMLSGFAGMPAWLVDDDVRGYEQKLESARRHLDDRSEPGWPAFLLLYAEALLSIYTGEPQRGFALFGADDIFQRSLIARRAVLGALGYANHRGRCAAAALGSAGSTSAQRRAAIEALHESSVLLKRHGKARSQGVAWMLDASLSFHKGARERAIRELRHALQLLTQAEVLMHAAAARRRLGQLVGGAEGERLLTMGEAFMRSQGVREVEKMTELNCPGFRTHP